MFRYEHDEAGRVIRIYVGDTWIADTSGEQYAQQIVQALNAWEEIKQLINEFTQYPVVDAPALVILAKQILDVVKD